MRSCCVSDLDASNIHRGRFFSDAPWNARGAAPCVQIQSRGFDELQKSLGMIDRPVELSSLLGNNSNGGPRGRTDHSRRVKQPRNLTLPLTVLRGNFECWIPQRSLLNAFSNHPVRADHNNPKHVRSKYTFLGHRTWSKERTVKLRCKYCRKQMRPV